MDNKAKDLQEVIKLYQDHYTWQHMTHKELADYLVPSISLNQYHIFRNKNDNTIYGFTNWAYMSNDSHKRFKETGMIEKFDWDSGKNLWYIDAISIHKGKLNEMFKWTMNNFKKSFEENKEVNWLRTNISGDEIKRVNKMKIKDGVRKFK